jgi:hypothetical protein
MFVEDFTPFLDTATGFAQSATVDGVAGVAVIFDNGYSLGNAGLLGMSGSQPSITLPTASVPSSPVGTAVTVNATAYLVAAHEPDGTGMSRLLLESAA